MTDKPQGAIERFLANPSLFIPTPTEMHALAAEIEALQQRIVECVAASEIIATEARFASSLIATDDPELHARLEAGRKSIERAGKTWR